MAQYRVTFTVEGKRIDLVKKAIQEQFGKEEWGIAVTKIDTSPSRSTRLGEAATMVEDAKSTVQDLHDEMEEWANNIPESFEEKRDQVQEAVDNLESILDSLEQADFDSVEFPGMYG